MHLGWKGLCSPFPSFARWKAEGFCFVPVISCSVASWTVCWPACSLPCLQHNRSRKLCHPTKTYNLQVCSLFLTSPSGGDRSWDWKGLARIQWQLYIILFTCEPFSLSAENASFSFSWFSLYPSSQPISSIDWTTYPFPSPIVVCFAGPTGHLIQH